MTPNRARNFIICAALLSFCSNTFAADVLEEIIVTATKRGDQDIQSIPASIYALSGSILEEKAHFDFRAVATTIPGLTFQDLGPGDMEFIIRGVNGNGPAVVGSYFGEYVITASDQQDGGGKNAPIKLIDMQRVEVLNGPQGTLYGANSMAGNIRYIPNKADTALFDAFGDIDLSTINSGGEGYTVSGGVNMPFIKDSLAGQPAWCLCPMPGLPELTTDDDYINSDVTTSPREDDIALWGATFTFDTSAGSFVLSGSDYDHDIDFTFDSTPILTGS